MVSPEGLPSRMQEVVERIRDQRLRRHPAPPGGPPAGEPVVVFTASVLAAPLLAWPPSAGEFTEAHYAKGTRKGDWMLQHAGSER